MNWQERAERAEVELARLREQKPALYVSFSDCGNFIRYWTRDTKNLEATMAVNDFEVLEFYAAPVPAPAVPNDIRSAVCSMLCALDAAIAGDRAHYINKSERARSVSRNWNAANVARAKVVSLLQSGSEPQKEYAWECNECGAQEYTMSVGQSIIESGALACGSCGCDEFHKAEVRHD